MRITCETKDTLNLSEITEFQGGLKVREDSDYTKIEKSIKKYGFATPFFIWKHDGINHVLDGHGRFETLKRMEKHGEVIPPLPVVYVNCENEEQAKNLLLRINSTYGKMTTDTIREFIGDLQIDLKDLKLPDRIIDLSAIAPERKTESDDEMPDLEETKVFSKVGEIYELGNHRLICGDSTDKEVIKKLMQNETADLILTDPPYNVDYEGKAESKLKIKNDKKTSSEFLTFLDKAFNSMLSVTKQGSSFYIFYAGLKASEFITSIQKQDITLNAILIWVKNKFAFGRSDYKWAQEPILYGWKNGKSHNFYGMLNAQTVLENRKKELSKMSKEELIEYSTALQEAIPTDVIRAPAVAKCDIHPTMKPVSLLQKLINNSSKVDDVVLDIFGGSGSTLIACEKTKRKARLCELDPVYCDAIRRRWAKWAKDNDIEVGSGGLE